MTSVEEKEQSFAILEIWKHICPWKEKVIA
jgi:hypothetical protein